MTDQVIRIPVQAWYGDKEMELNFPTDWEVQECQMAGHNAPALGDGEIHAALQTSVGTKPLGKLARGRRQAVILFDDLTRPAPTAKVLPFVVDDILAAGIEADNIRFVAAYANHAPMRRDDFVKKLGEAIVKRFRVYNHNPYEHLVDLGKTSRGTPVLINREVLACDLKIGIGGLIPHRGAGFGGGAKLVFPGVAGIISTDYNHRVIGSMDGDKSAQENLRLGIDLTEVRQDIEEATQKVGLDMKIDLLVNNRREIVDIFVGDFIAQHRAGLSAAKQLYATAVAKECDIVVSNAYPIENQPIKGIWPGHVSLKEGGIMVLIAQSPEGIAHHYLASRFGHAYGGTMWAPTTKPLVPKAKKFILCSAYPSRKDLEFFGPAESVVCCESWNEVLTHLIREYPLKAKVAVYPYAAIQMPASQAK